MTDCSLSKKRARRNRDSEEDNKNNNLEPSSKLQCTEMIPSTDLSKDNLQSEKEEVGGEGNLLNNTADYGYGYSSSGELYVRYPIAVVSHREGIHKCDLSGKPSLSGFK